MVGEQVRAGRHHQGRREDDQRRRQRRRAAADADDGRRPTAPATTGCAGAAYEPRFLFTWPNHEDRGDGPEQLAGVMEIVARQSRRARARSVDEEALTRATKAMSRADRARVDCRSSPAGELWDDGIIDPRDTRTVLGIASRLIRRTRPGASASSGVGMFRASRDSSRGPRRQPRRDRAARLRGPAARLGHRDGRRSTPTPTRRAVRRARPTRRSGCPAGRARPSPTSASTRVLDGRRARRAPTRSTRATASSPRTPTSPGAASRRRPGLDRPAARGDRAMGSQGRAPAR